MKNNHFLQIAAVALCLLTVSYAAIPLGAYLKMAPWQKFSRWKVDHNGPQGETSFGTWYQYSNLPGKNGGADWGQFICIAGGNQCRAGAHATGWDAPDSQKGTELKITPAFGPFEGEHTYDAECDCYQ